MKAPYRAIADIPPATPDGQYRTDVPWASLAEYIRRRVEDDELELDPDFQRGHVWTEGQREAYVEHALAGGTGSHTVRLNHPGWGSGAREPFVLVDGRQRLEAVLRFLGGEVRAFGRRLPEYADGLAPWAPVMQFRVNTLRERAAVPRWYLEMNTGATPHAPEEIERVRALLAAEERRRG